MSREMQDWCQITLLAGLHILYGVKILKKMNF